MALFHVLVLLSASPVSFGPPRQSFAPGIQSSAQIAFAPDSGVSLVVWRDERVIVQRPGVFAARLRGDLVLDPTGIPLTYELNTINSEPQVATDGTDFLVVWTQDPNPTNGPLTTRACRVTASGAALDFGGSELLTPAPADRIRPAVTWDGSAWLVLIEQPAAGSSALWRQRISRAGALLDGPAGFAVWPSGLGRSDVRLAKSFGPVSLISLRDSPTSVAAVKLTGDVLGPVLPVDTTAAFSRTVPVGTELPDGGWLIGWARFSAAAASEIYLSRVSDVVESPGGVALTATGTVETEPALAASGPAALAVWQVNGGYDSVYGARLPQGGIAADLTVPVATSGGSADSPAIAFDGTDALTVFEIGTGYANDVFAQRFLLDGGVGPQVLISSSFGTQLEPAAVAIDGGFLAVWGERAPSFGEQVVTGFVTASATGEVLSVSLGFDTNNLELFSLATDGVTALAVYGEDSATSDVKGQLLEWTGAASGAPFVIAANAATHEHSPQIAFNGTDYLVTWHRNVPVTDVQARRVSAAGVPLGVASQVFSGGTVESSRACGGAGWALVVVSSSTVGVQAFPLVAAGTSFTIGQRFTVANAVAPRCATVRPDRAGVFWRAGGGTVLMGTEVVVDGGQLFVSAPVPVAALPASPELAVAFDGVEYVVGWPEIIDAGFSLQRMVHVAQSFVLSDAGSQVTPVWVNAQPLVLTSDAAGRVLALSSRFDTSAGVNSQRLAGVLFTDAGTPDAGGGDAGVADAGSADGGPAADAGFTPKMYAVGCGCQSSGAAALLLGALPWLVRRRRTRLDT